MGLFQDKRLLKKRRATLTTTKTKETCPLRINLFILSPTPLLEGDWTFSTQSPPRIIINKGRKPHPLIPPQEGERLVK